MFHSSEYNRAGHVLNHFCISEGINIKFYIERRGQTYHWNTSPLSIEELQKLDSFYFTQNNDFFPKLDKKIIHRLIKNGLAIIKDDIIVAGPPKKIHHSSRIQRRGYNRRDAIKQPNDAQQKARKYRESRKPYRWWRVKPINNELSIYHDMFNTCEGSIPIPPRLKPYTKKQKYENSYNRSKVKEFARRYD